MNLEELRKDRQKWMTWKNIKPLRDALDTLEDATFEVELDDIVKISSEQKQDVEEVARLMMPWRKGPFEIFDCFIDAEWKSNIKYNLLRKHFNLKDKRVADGV